MKVGLKISYTILTVFILLVLLSTSVRAANEGLTIVKSGEDYIIYVKGYESSKFSFAFANESNPDVSKLKFTNNWTDMDGTNVACLDSQSGIDLTNKIFIWITDEKGNAIISGGELDLNLIVDMEDVEDLNSLTTRIPVDSTQSTTTKDHIDGITKTKVTGKLVITDSPDYMYQYSLQKITESSNASELVSLLNEINNSETEKMVEKVDLIQAADEKLDNLVDTATWTDVSNMTVNQPIDSNEGDQYAVLLQKLDNSGKIVETDVQVLECRAQESEERVVDSTPVRVTSSLPVTGEDITLYVILGIIVLLIIAVIVRLVFLKSRKNNETK